MRHIVTTALAAVLSLVVCAAPAHAEGRSIIPIEREKALDLVPMGMEHLEKAKPSGRIGIKREDIGPSVMDKKEPLVRITSPRAGKVGRAYQKVVGKLGGEITKAFVSINGAAQAVTAKDGAFLFHAALVPGTNTITALGWDLDGNLGKDSISVFYEPGEGAPLIKITGPKDGTTVDVTDRRVITVEAASSMVECSEAVIVQNNIPRPIGFKGGSIRQDVALAQGSNEIYIEAVDSRGKVSRSNTVHVVAFDARPKDLLAMLYWDSPTADLDLHAWDSFGHHSFVEAPDSRCSDAAIPGGTIDMDKKGGYGPEVFSLQYAEPEVYTFYAKYNPGFKDRGATAYLKLILHPDEPARRLVRNLGPVYLDEKNPSWEAAHVKMPEGIFFQEKSEDLKKTLGMDARAVKRLAVMLKEENDSFRLLAISAMGQIKSEDAVPALLEALTDKSPEVRCAAAGALWNIKSPRSADGLVKALLDPSPEVRRAAAGALGHIGLPASLPALVGLISGDGDVYVKIEAIRAIGRLRSPGAVPDLLKLVKDHDPAVRAETLHSLGMLGDETVGPAVVEALSDREKGVREVAAWALGWLGDRTNTKALMDTLRFDTEEGVRAQAASSLGLLKDVSALEELDYAVKRDFSQLVRFCASQAAEEISSGSDETLRDRRRAPKPEQDDDVVVY